MTAEQLEELLGVLHYGKWPEQHQALHKVRELAPSLARRVIAAEKLVEALEEVLNYAKGNDPWYGFKMAQSTLTAYREASK